MTGRNGRLRYIADVLKKIVDGHLARKLDELMPWAYVQPGALKNVACKQC